MRTRTPSLELERDAVEALTAAAAAVGLASAPSVGAGSPDLTFTLPDGGRVPVHVKAASIPTAEQARQAVAAGPHAGHPVLVADQVSAATRELLNEAGVGWLDRRGHFRFVVPGVFVDADVPAQPRRGPSVPSEPISGRSGIAAATGLLLRPDDPIGVTEAAEIAKLNPSSITRALGSLVDAHLAERKGRGRYRALLPELFWAVADVWPRRQVPIRWSGDPGPWSDASGRAAYDPGDSSWVAAGVRGALVWGAPLVVTADYPTELYVPDEQVIRRVAARHLGGSGPEIALSVDPNGFVTHRAYNASFAWPVADPLFCALDLTRTSRDREALEQWTPPEGFTRVW
jgi:hypothetical protein